MKVESDVSYKRLRVVLGLNARRNPVDVGLYIMEPDAKKRQASCKALLDERVVKQKTECAHFTRLVEERGRKCWNGEKVRVEY